MEIAECTVDTAQFRMIVSNEWERFRVESLETKEPETIRWILENFGPGDILLDVGANIGIYTIFAAAFNRAGTVVAVEPMAANVARLCENARLNNLTNVVPYCVALAARNGLAQLNLVSLAPASSMHSLDDSTMSGEFGEAIVMRTGIGVATVDEIAAVAGMPAMMKIDVDGGEDAILAGAAGVLSDHRLRTVLIEFNMVEGSAVREIRAAPLLEAGFALQDVGIEYERNGVTWQNAIYVRSASPSPSASSR